MAASLPQICNRNHRLAVGLAAVVLFTPAPGLAATFVQGTVATGTNAAIGGQSDPKSQSTSAVAAPAMLSASSLSNVTTTANGSASAFASSNASWASANAGTVSFSWGWRVDQSGTTFGLATGELRNWTYSFTTGAQAERFVANWTLTTNVAAGSTFGLQGIYGSGGLPFTVSPFQFSPTDGAGSFVVDLNPNSSYTFELYNSGNASGAGFLADVRARADVRWVIESTASVPEPATWALLIVGFGMIGSATRHSRKLRMVPC